MKATITVWLDLDYDDPDPIEINLEVKDFMSQYGEVVDSQVQVTNGKKVVGDSRETPAPKTKKAPKKASRTVRATKNEPDPDAAFQLPDLPKLPEMDPDKVRFRSVDPRLIDEDAPRRRRGS